MAHTTIHSNQLAFFAETTPCVAPVDWAASGTCIEHLSVDVGNVKQTLLADPTLETRWSRVGTRRQIKGIRNVEWSTTLKFHGTGVTTAPASQVAQTYLGTILRHCLGGVHRSNSTLLTGGSAAQPEVTSATNIIPGCLVFFEDTTSPTDQNDGKLHPRVVLDVTGTVLTLDEELPFTPAAGDIAQGTITGYLHDEYLIDARANSGTMMWFYKKHISNTDLLWQLEGTVASFQLQNLGPGQLPQIVLNNMSANFRLGDEDGLTSPAFTSIQGKAQLSTSRDILCTIQEYGTDTIHLVHVNNVAFEPGFTRSKVLTTTEIIHRFNGLDSYSVNPGGPSKLTLTLTRYSDDWYASLRDDVDYRVRIYQPGDGSGAGKAWCVHFSKCQIAETPTRADVGDVNGITVVFQAMVPDNVTAASNEDLETSRFLIGMA